MAPAASIGRTPDRFCERSTRTTRLAPKAWWRNAPSVPNGWPRENCPPVSPPARMGQWHSATLRTNNQRSQNYCTRITASVGNRSWERNRPSSMWSEPSDSPTEPSRVFVPEGHSAIAQRFNVGNRHPTGDKSRRDGRRRIRLQPSLRDLRLSRLASPTLKRWATFEHPFGIALGPDGIGQECPHCAKPMGEGDSPGHA